ncbi:hypothetical protein [Nocardia sp. 348MFTsu5.1]|uniref:hypothetical protein n=1 Tax=Nocardia sp. 348MFTsu5.1 TaxID=1172185 RepID=UPI0012DFE540|nr:hypothetical protein [Nocardia sp. 348MFTsu5.1]
MSDSRHHLVRALPAICLIVGVCLGLAGCSSDSGSSGAGGNRLANASEVLGPGQEQESTADYSKIDPETLTVEQFYDDSVYPEQYRIQWADQVIEERTTPELLAEIEEKLAGGHREPLGPLVPASIDNTGDEILVQQSVAGYIASKEPNPDMGRKLLAGFISPDNPGFEGAKNQLGGGQFPVLATYAVNVEANDYSKKKETPVFTETAIGNYAPNGTPSKLMTIMNTFNSESTQVTDKYESGRWIVVNTISFPDSNWIAHPDEVAVK